MSPPAENLKQQTNTLKAYNEEAASAFNEIRNSEREVDFFVEVKPFVDRVQAAADQWLESAEQWVKTHQPREVYPSQLNDTHENITILAVKAFQHDTKERRFKEMVQSVEYVLNSLLQAVEEVEEENGT
ncbi:uncharacterized protein DUF1798 [Salsuginibacillus halophilus]|uniref:Uncharacterized protein DUF1798 n=1 Tax=Salsuginibacillus halophilus TaxID=517424 RepID=A0A2P8HWK4_9BACI|nr:YppE family protein [Salsuginibacillus halophilus]PSL50545.1 uncharacterized protein DUF1798 [Salsuginibacillus halophilus]